MPEWRKYRLENILSIVKNNVKPCNIDECNYIGLEHIVGKSFLLNDIGSSQDVESNKYFFKPNDILYGKLRPYFQKVYKPNFKGICSTDIFVIRTKDEKVVSQDFLYQIVREKKFTEWAMEGHTGTRMPRVDWQTLRKKMVLLPDDLNEQHRIAEILSSLDDKIELNLEMNKTLEEMAMAIYKEWFVDFGPFRDGEFVDSELGPIPKGFNLDNISNLFVFSKGVSYRSKYLDNEGNPMINLKCFSRDGLFREQGIKGYSGEYKERHIVIKGDLLVAMTDLTQDRVILGSPLLVPDIKTEKPIIISTDVGVLREKLSTNEMKLMVYYLMKRYEYHEYILGHGNGSTVMHLDKNGILNCNILAPPIPALRQFNNLIKPLIDLMDCNRNENKNLIETRDYLLPKLISGEVRVKAAEEKVKEVL